MYKVFVAIPLAIVSGYEVKDNAWHRYPNVSHVITGLFIFSLGIQLVAPNRGKGLGMTPEDEEKPVPMATSEAERKGGRKVREKYGEDHYQRIGRKGGAALKEKRGSEYYSAIARKGGRANANKYGLEHFSEIGKKGGNATKARRGADFYSQIGKKGGAARHQKKTE